MATFQFNTFPLKVETDILYVVYDNHLNDLSVLHKTISKHLVQLEKSTEFQLMNKGTFITSIINNETKRILTLKSIKLDSSGSRNLGFLRNDILSKEIKTTKSNTPNISIVSFLNQNQLCSFVSCIAQCFPLFTKKTNSNRYDVNVYLFDKSGSTFEIDKIKRANLMLNGIGKSMILVDTPCNELHVNEYLKRIKETFNEIKQKNENIDLKIIQDDQLTQNGLNGIYSVGMAAVNKPALAILSLNEKTDMKGIALVGKGICYDTGGLSIKSGLNMISMKGDMGGSAAVLNAFSIICKLNIKTKIYALLCLAENAVDQLSIRPDDIITMHSGKTVEVNNTDAEGRLVLADGVSYASKVLGCEYIIDIATLTGAQIMCTGKHISTIMSNNKELEELIIECGKKSGDLVFPMLYCPELIMPDLKSEVADMKNSAKGKVTAMSSLAGHFIESHLDKNFKGEWAHIDIAGPAFRDERATGFGTALLVTIVEHLSKN